MSDYVKGLGKCISIAIDHLLAVPKGVVVILTEVHAGFQYSVEVVVHSDD